MGYSTKPTILF